MDNPRLKYWPILFLITFIEGILALVWLGLIPPDVKNSVLIGFSAKRLLMMAFILAIAGAGALGGWFSWRKRAWRESWLNPNQRPLLFRWLTIGSLVTAFCLELGLLFLRYYDPSHFGPLFIRSRPLLVFLLLVCVQLAACLLVFRFGRDLKLFWRQIILWTLVLGQCFLAVFLGLLSVWRGSAAYLVVYSDF